MQLALNQLAAHLQKGLRPLYTLQGDEPLQLQEAAAQLAPFPQKIILEKLKSFQP